MFCSFGEDLFLLQIRAVSHGSTQLITSKKSKNRFVSGFRIFFSKFVLSSVFYKTHTHTDSTEKNRHKRQRVKYIACEIYRIGPPLSVSRHTHFQNKPFFSAFFKTSDENTHVQTHSLQRFAIVCTPSARAREQERKCGGLKRRRRRRRIILVA